MPPRGRQRTRRYNNNVGALTNFFEVRVGRSFLKIESKKRGSFDACSAPSSAASFGRGDPDGSEGPRGGSNPSKVHELA